jgi:hypothetical protein
MKASDWRDVYNIAPKGGLGMGDQSTLIDDLESLEAENARLTDSLSQANARLEVMRRALELASKELHHGSSNPGTRAEVSVPVDVALSAQPKGDVRERVRDMLADMFTRAFNITAREELSFTAEANCILSAIAGVEE